MDTILQDPQTQQALANIFIMVLTTLVTVLTKASYSYLKANTSEKQFSLLEALAASAVSAAEQGAIAGFVNDRKATAVAIVNAGLASAGIKNITGEQVDAAIEAAVKDGLNYDKQVGDKTAAEIEAEAEND